MFGVAALIEAYFGMKAAGEEITGVTRSLRLQDCFFLYIPM